MVDGLVFFAEGSKTVTRGSGKIRWGSLLVGLLVSGYCPGDDYRVLQRVKTMQLLE